MVMIAATIECNKKSIFFIFVIFTRIGSEHKNGPQCCRWNACSDRVETMWTHLRVGCCATTRVVSWWLFQSVSSLLRSSHCAANEIFCNLNPSCDMHLEKSNPEIWCSCWAIRNDSLPISFAGPRRYGLVPIGTFLRCDVATIRNITRWRFFASSLSRHANRMLPVG